MNQHATNESYVTADDTEVLVPSDGATRHRRNSPRAAPIQDATCERRQSKDHVCHSKQINQNVDKTARNQLIVVSVLCTLFMAAEIAGGILANSLALVTDATHLASDLASFIVSLVAIWLATKPPSHRLNFGYHRAEILGALVSILIIWLVTGVLVYIAINRVIHDDFEIEANDMLIVAAIGVAFNIIMGLVLQSGLFKSCRLPASIGHNHSHGGVNSHSHGGVNSHSHGGVNSHSHGDEGHSHGFYDVPDHTAPINTDIDHQTINRLDAGIHREHEPVDDITILAGSGSPGPEVNKQQMNINVRAAAIHVLGDFIQSIGVLIAALIIKFKPEYKLADPICTFIFSVLVLITTITVLKDVVSVLMEATPSNLKYQDIQRDLGDIEGVRSVHSLCVWALTVSKAAASVHIAIDTEADWAATLERATGILHNKYAIYTSSVQVERYYDEMSQCAMCQL